MVARAWGRGEQYPPDDSESEADETGSQVERRYMEATQSEVSDPDLWALNYGDGSDDGETMEGWFMRNCSAFEVWFFSGQQRHEWASKGKCQGNLDVSNPMAKIPIAGGQRGSPWEHLPREN